MIDQVQRSKALIIAILFVSLSMGLWTSAWFEIHGRGTYTEGIEREPSIVIEYSIDSSQESISLSLENATPLLQYWRDRETITNTDTNDEQQQENYSKNLGQAHYILVLAFLVLLYLNIHDTCDWEHHI